MKIVHRISELDHPEGITTGFVPTMGAFHEGHLSLMRTAKSENDRCVVSLFVNPTQFGRNEDFDKYPRNLERDAGMAADAGVDVLFAPSSEEMYPRTGTTIHVSEVTERWEGAVRPGHFDGVATVVSKLLNIVRPRRAYFGLKDLQQCMVIQRMCQDLNVPCEIELRPTMREPDGLAMSSRNVYLSAENRKAAPMIYQELKRSAEAIRKGANAEHTLSGARAALANAGFRVDYFELVDLPSMVPVLAITSNCAIIAAARLGATRLIDNVLL